MFPRIFLFRSGTESNLKMALDDIDEDRIATSEVLSSAEYFSWCVLILAPIVFYLNGPAVSLDQRIVRIGLVAVSGVTVAILRLVKRQRKRRIGD
jgi:hypothetical protein